MTTERDIETEDTRIIDAAWNDPAYTLEGIDHSQGVEQTIDRDQAVDGAGDALYDYYALSKDISDEESPVPEWDIIRFTSETMERYAEEW